MLRYMAGVRCRDLKKRRPRWFRHVRREEGGMLSENEKEGWRLTAEVRPKKRWRECVMEDMKLLKIEHMAQDRLMWKWENVEVKKK
ncbi:hypothetical protein E2C01_031511 [Portunus trituberculatus]|uniref:Uncharacterized protein n=1 Tax=Portunus trituberculatus TaxID=210409 RepID=A0A5B7EYR9_PORTR|nr:hypothetical protein [Portunus trituberculatus]